MDYSEEDGSVRPFTARIRESAPPPTCQLLLFMVDEAICMMRCLKFVSEKTLEKLELSKGTLDAETYGALNEIKLCSVAYEAASGIDIPIKEKELSTAAWRACRLFSTKEASLKYFFATREEQSSSLQMFYQILEQFRRLVLKRLTTTLEEESAINAYLNEVFRREERAIKDHTSLSQQLQTERDLRSKAFEDFKFAEHQLHEEAQTEKNNALAAQRQLQQEFDALEEDESKSFSQKGKKLTEESAQLKSTLDKMQEDNRVLELTARGKKEQSVEEVTNLLRDYKAELTKKRDELDRLSEQHKTVDEKMRFYKDYYEQRAREEKQRQDEADLKAREDFKFKRNAKIIQRRWKYYAKKKKAEEIARKKKEAAAKKKKK